MKKLAASLRRWRNNRYLGVVNWNAPTAGRMVLRLSILSDGILAVVFNASAPGTQTRVVKNFKVSGNGVIAIYILLSFVSIAGCAQAATYYPPSETLGGWRSLVTPNTDPSASQKQQILTTTGVDWDKLKLAWNYVAPHTSALFVVRNGWVVGNWGSAGGFYLNSISKSITGVALARMFTQSAAGTGPSIGPDDFVYQHLPSSWGDANPARHAIQIKHLMTHSSGLLTDQGFGPATCDYFTQQPVVAPPGTLWAYSNSNALLESTMVHWKSGLSLKDYSTSR